METAPQLAAKLSELLTDTPALQAARSSAAKTLSGLRGATAKTVSTITSAVS